MPRGVAPDLLFIGLLACSLTACAFDPRVPGGLPCGTDGACPRGLSCQDGRCCAAGGCGPMIGADGGEDRPASTVKADATDVSLNPPTIPAARCNPVDDRCGPGTGCRIMGCDDSKGWLSDCAPPGGANEGEVCQHHRDCGAGLACIDPKCASGTAQRRCQKACITDRDCGAGAECAGLEYCLQGALGYCLRRCDRASAAGSCAEGLGCEVLPGDEGFCTCRPPAGGDGAPCVTVADCGAGEVCAHLGASSRCRPICALGQGSCSAGRSCIALPDYRTYGACVPDGELPPRACDPTDVSSCAEGGCGWSCDQSGRVQLQCQSRVPLAADMRCQQAGDCPVGSSCVPEDGCESLAFCRQHCKTDADCGPGAARCLRGLLRCGLVLSPHGICVSPCNPLGAARDGCPQGTLCDLGWKGVTTCVCPSRFSAATDGQPCRGTACGPGHMCSTEASGFVCRRLCRHDDPETCAEGRRCVPLYNDVNHGICVPNDQ